MSELKRFLNTIIDGTAAYLGHFDTDERLRLLDQFEPQLKTLVDEAVAVELERQSEFYFEAAALYEPARDVADANGDEMAPVLDMQIRTMREVSARLRRRSAAVRGISPEELAARGLLLIPAETTGEDDPPTEVEGKDERTEPGTSEDDVRREPGEEDGPARTGDNDGG